MLRTTPITCAAAVLAALTTAALAPAGADAARATFSVKLDAHKTVTWDHPRTEAGGDCNGKRYIEGHGSEDFKLWSSDAAGRLVVEGSARKLTSWEFGTQGERRTLVSEPPEAKTVRTRQNRTVTGTTGGWCGGGDQDPVKTGDCGTKILPFVYRVSIDGKEIGFTESPGRLERERFNYFECRLTVPKDMYTDSFPKLRKELPLAKLFAKGRKPITIEATKDYGPTLFPLGGGANMTASGAVTWTMTLTRVGDLKPRSENG